MGCSSSRLQTYTLVVPSMFLQVDRIERWRRNNCKILGSSFRQIRTKQGAFIYLFLVYSFSAFLVQNRPYSNYHVPMVVHFVYIVYMCVSSHLCCRSETS